MSSSDDKAKPEAKPSEEPQQKMVVLSTDGAKVDVSLFGGVSRLEAEIMVQKALEAFRKPS